MSTSDEAEDQENPIDVYENDNIIYLPDIDTTCTICQAEFLDASDLKIHLDQVHKIPNTVLNKCQFCLEEYSDVMEYAEHLRDLHLCSIKCCSYCWRMFDNYDDHKNHVKNHIVNQKLSSSKCSQCPQRFSNVGTLKEHEFTEHKYSIDGVFLNDVFPYLSAVLKVKSITFLESIDTDVVYICVGCDLSTVDINTYLRHVRADICKVYVCDKCGNVFKRMSLLIRHLKQSACDIYGVNNKKIRLCTECNTYVSSFMFWKHKKECKPIKCPTCKINFLTVNEWSEHQSMEHGNVSVEVQTCQFCYKRCVGSEAMKKHVNKLHRPEFHLYKYLCVYCDNVFKHPQKLFSHFYSKHKDMHPYTCKICYKTFRLRKKFTIHIKVAHKSEGYVEFDENYHVFFTDKKSEQPFIPKSIFPTESSDIVEILDDDAENTDLKSDVMNGTDIDDAKTDTVAKKRKSNRKRKANIDNTATIGTSDEDEPLLNVRKRVCMQKKKTGNGPSKRISMTERNRLALTCKTCNKYCYTYQNYNHHVALHSKHEEKKCIKCSKVFKSKSKLELHIATDHSSSKLTDTLKVLLEKRKTGGHITDDLPPSIKFRRTIRKVNVEPTRTPAEITPVEQKISVQKFLENFLPEENKETHISTCASIKLVTGQPKEPKIKMTPFKPTPLKSTFKLAMPVKFVDNYPEKVKLKVNIVKVVPTMDTAEYNSDYGDDTPDLDRNETIPEVAEEILLEVEENQKIPQGDVTHKIVLPNIPSELSDFRIAHLYPQAPFYKIVKVKDVLESNGDIKEEPSHSEPENSIKLPDGTKLVTTNPLAHLLGNQQEKILQSVKNKYYKPKNRNIQSMLTKALSMLEKPTPIRKKK